MDGEEVTVTDAAEQEAMGMALLEANDIAAAWEAFKAALALDPVRPQAVYGLSECLMRRKQFVEAENLLRTYAFPHAELRAQLGSALYGQERWQDAEAEYRAAQAGQPPSPRAGIGLGLALMNQDRTIDARAELERHLRAYANDAHAWIHLASCCRMLGDMAAAFSAYRHGLSLLPEGSAMAVSGHWELGLTALALGDYATGFEELEWRLEALMGKHVAAMREVAPPWEGVVARGRSILLWFEQGLGDTIHFARYAQLLGKLGMEVHLWVQPQLARLLRTMPHLAGVYVMGDVLPPMDCQAALISVPHLLRLGGRGLNIPRAMPYLFPDAAEVERWRQRLDALTPPGGGRRVGLVWAGNPGFGLDSRRTLDLDALAPILDVPGNAFFSLQMGERRVAAERLAHWGIIDLTDGIADFADTAAAMMALDLVISVDTSTVHCAGALARPTWLPLYQPPDWRWGLTGDETIWYPTIRLFRQTVQGQWDDVIRAMADALRALPTPS